MRIHNIRFIPGVYSSISVLLTYITFLYPKQVLEDFELENDINIHCSNDFDTLSIYDSDVEDEARLIGRFCGTNYESYVRSSGPNMLLVFKSDLYLNMRGYMATYSFAKSMLYYM